MTSSGRRWLQLAAAVLAMVATMAGLAWLAGEVWADSGIRIGLHGWLALTIALVGTVVVGVGLMWLAFYSSRSGWDDIDRDQV